MTPAEICRARLTDSRDRLRRLAQQAAEDAADEGHTFAIVRRWGPDTEMDLLKWGFTCAKYSTDMIVIHWSTR